MINESHLNTKEQNDLEENLNTLKSLMVKFKEGEVVASNDNSKLLLNEKGIGVKYKNGDMWWSQWKHLLERLNHYDNLEKLCKKVHFEIERYDEL